MNQILIYNGSSWLELKKPADSVSSVNGQTGVVTLAKTDVGLSNVPNTNIAYSSTIPGGDFLQAEVDNLRAAKLDDGTTPWTSASSITTGTLDNAHFDALSDLGGGTGTTFLQKDGTWTTPTETDPGLQTLTSAEIDQLETIDTQTITNAQWGYLGAMTSQPVEADTTCAATDSCADILYETEIDTLAELNTQLSASIADGSHTVLGTSSNAITLTGDNIGLMTCADGQILEYSNASSDWVCDTDSGALSLGALTDLNSGISPSNGDILFYDTPNLQWDSTSILSIDKVNGRVGIGTTIPAYPLHLVSSGVAEMELKGATSAELDLYETSGVVDERRGRLTLDSGNFNLEGLNDSDNVVTHTFLSGDLSNGNVGIGTTEPGTLLTLKKNSASNKIELQDLGVFTGGSGKIGTGRDGTEAYSYFGQDSNENIVVRDGGNVGIGTVNPSQKFTIYDASQAQMALEVPGAGDQWNLISDSVGKFRIYSNDSAVTRLTINNTGNVGIGTTNPLSNLHIDEGTTNSELLESLRIESSDTVDTSAGISFYADSAIVGGIYGGRTDTAFRAMEFRHQDATGATNQAIRFFTTESGPTTNQALTILAGGSVGIGTTNPSNKLHVDNVGSAGDYAALIQGGALGNGLLIKAGDTTATEQAPLVVANNGGTPIFTVLSNTSYPSVKIYGLSGSGAVTVMADNNGTLYKGSDARLKNIVGTYDRGLEDVVKLSPKVFTWNESSKLTMGVENYGFIAQEVEEAIPEAVSMGSDGYRGLSDRAIIAAMVNAIKELKVEVDSKQEQINSLKLENELIKEVLCEKDDYSWCQ